jgi:hypothetical protein
MQLLRRFCLVGILVLTFGVLPASVAAGPGMDVPTNGASPPVGGVESEAGPQAPLAEPPPAACDIAGQWRMDTANIGQSTWTFTPSGNGSYAGQEQGLGNATGEAVMNGNAMRMEWRTGGYSGLVELSIDPSCSAGQGRHIFYTGRTDTQPTRWQRIGAAPATQVYAPGTAEGGGGAPSPIHLEAVIGGRQVAAELTRTGPDSWQWVENGVTFSFRPLLDTSAQLVIYDRSRDMFHRLNFGTSETA